MTQVLESQKHAVEHFPRAWFWSEIPMHIYSSVFSPKFQTSKKKKVSLLSGDNESKRSRPQKIVQVGPKRRCSQFEHHAWLFCRETKWKPLQTQVQNPASVRDSLKPRISPDHFQLVNLTLRGAPVSEPIRDVYKCYQHLHIITYSSTSASNSVANMRGCFLGLVLACRDACYWRLCPLAEWLMRKWSAEIRKQGYFRRKTLQSFELCLTFWSLNRDPSVGKTENTQRFKGIDCLKPWLQRFSLSGWTFMQSLPPWWPLPFSPFGFAPKERVSEAM